MSLELELLDDNVAVSKTVAIETAPIEFDTNEVINFDSELVQKYVQPLTVHPHIVTSLRRLWATPACYTYIRENLILDTRDGTRKGFAFAVWNAIHTLCDMALFCKESIDMKDLLTPSKSAFDCESYSFSTRKQ